MTNQRKLVSFFWSSRNTLFCKFTIDKAKAKYPKSLQTVIMSLPINQINYFSVVVWNQVHKAFIVKLDANINRLKSYRDWKISPKMEKSHIFGCQANLILTVQNSSLHKKWSKETVGRELSHISCNKYVGPSNGFSQSMFRYTALPDTGWRRGSWCCGQYHATWVWLASQLASQHSNFPDKKLKKQASKQARQQKFEYPPPKKKPNKNLSTQH